MTQQINLYNPIFLAQKKYFSAAAMLQALGAVLAGMLLLEVMAVRQTAGLERLLADVTREAAQQREQLLSLARQYSDQGTSKKLEEDIAQAEEQLRKRRELLGEMTSSIGGTVNGFSGYLTALARQRTQGVWLTGIEISGKSNDLVIRGRALNSDLVPAYVRSLSRDPAFAGRTLSSLQVIARETPRPAPAADARVPDQVRQPLRYLEFTLNIPLAEEAAGMAPRAQKGAS